MNQIRHGILKCRFSGPPEAYIDGCAENFYGVGNQPKEFDRVGIRESDIWNAIEATTMHHLGYQLTKPVEYFLEKGFDVVVDYFCGDWWKDVESIVEQFNKPINERYLLWIQPFSQGLLIGLLTERWDDIAKVCSWVEADLPPEYTGGDFEDELVHVYRSIAAGLRPEPMPGLEEVEAQILKCRKQRPKLLFQAWQAAREGDQKAFEEAFLKALKHFEENFDPENSDPGDYCVPFNWIAPHHSVLAMAAMCLGMKLPPLSPKQDAWIITRQSLCLPS